MQFFRTRGERTIAVKNSAVSRFNFYFLEVFERYPFHRFWLDAFCNDLRSRIRVAREHSDILPVVSCKKHSLRLDASQFRVLEVRNDDNFLSRKLFFRVVLTQSGNELALLGTEIYM